MTLSFLTFLIGALFGSVVQRMVLQLLPPMAHVAPELVLTPLDRIVVDHLLWLPIRACNRLIIKRLGSPSVILPVMSVDAECFIMLGEIERAEHSFVVESTLTHHYM